MVQANHKTRMEHKSFLALDSVRASILNVVNGARSVENGSAVGSAFPSIFRLSFQSHRRIAPLA